MQSKSTASAQAQAAQVKMGGINLFQHLCNRAHVSHMALEGFTMHPNLAPSSHIRVCPSKYRHYYPDVQPININKE